MKQNLAKISLIFLLIFLANCSKNSDENRKILIDNGEMEIAINVQIADDNNERAKGLMFVEKLDENAGMFFIFEMEEYRTFWMKNTLIQLDIIFVDDKLKIVDIKNAVPCKQDPCALYTSKKPAKYILEVNSGFAERNDIKEGDKIAIKGQNQ